MMMTMMMVVMTIVIMVLISDSKSGQKCPLVGIAKAQRDVECLCFSKGLLNAHKETLVF